VDEGKGDHLYDRSLQASVQKTFVAPSLQNDFNFLAYIHPPFEAMVYGLLALMPYPTAFWTFWVCNLLLAYASVLILRPQMPFLYEGFGLAFLAMALFKPLLTAEIQGQDSIVMLFLVIACYLGLVHDRPLLAGFSLGLACCKPQQALLLLLLVMITSTQRWRIFAGFMAACASLAAVSVLTVGWKATVGYPHAVKVFASLYDEVNDHPNTMPNVRGLTLSVLQGRVSHQSLMAIVEIVSAIALIVTVWILRSRRHAEIQIRFSVLVSCVLLIAFYGYSHDFTPLLLPVLLMWNFLAREGLNSFHRKLLAGCLAVLVCGGLLSILSSQVLGCMVLLFWALLWMELYRVGPVPSSEIRA
jgi:hypothetical protein